MDREHWRPFVAWEIVESDDARRGIAEREQAEPARNLDRIARLLRVDVWKAPNAHRRRRLRVEMSLERGELRGLRAREHFACPVAGERLRGGGDAGKPTSSAIEKARR